MLEALKPMNEKIFGNKIFVIITTRRVLYICRDSVLRISPQDKVEDLNSIIIVR